MTTHQAKQDLRAKLAARRIDHQRLTARTIDFSDLARAKPVFVTIHGAVLSAAMLHDINTEVPRPSQGGYVIETNNCKWI